MPEPDQRQQIDAGLSQIKKEYLNLKRKYARCVATRDTRRMRGLWQKTETIEAAIASLRETALKAQAARVAPVNRKSYSYDLFEEKLIKRRNRYE